MGEEEVVVGIREGVDPREEARAGRKGGVEADQGKGIQEAKDHEARTEEDDPRAGIKENHCLKAETKEGQEAKGSLLHLKQRKVKELNKKMLLTVQERKSMICLLMKAQRIKQSIKTLRSPNHVKNLGLEDYTDLNLETRKDLSPATREGGQDLRT